ncbi:FRG domain-containing protein [Acinetobacter sp. YH12201]|uniref:FRG domain-containing protein n=1 Tax=Acinetobacter sp. YH12201 TaxID=2601140 RepID=UPI0015D45A32|nr:FRG domain-containing protein [Acinetobacter sp. YH12201]
MDQYQQYDWDRIPVWNKDNLKDSFILMNDQINGRIPVTKLEHWNQFTSFLESEFCNRKRVDLVFRGHRRYDWGLTPTLARFNEQNTIDEELAEAQLKLFRKAIRGRISDHSLFNSGDKREDDELWAIGQHYGLKTPLLDWTYSPYVALFFAFAKADEAEETDNPYRAIYILNKTAISDDEYFNDIRVLEPRKDDHGRLVNQAGLFTFSPYGLTIENKLIEVLGSEDYPDDELKNASQKAEEEPAILAKYICKVFVKNEQQKECLKFLRRMNVHHASLFPDLIGAADYSNILIEEWEQHRQDKKAVLLKPEPIVIAPPGIHAEIFIPSPTIESQDITSIVKLLHGSLSQDEVVEKDLLDRVAYEIAKILTDYKKVDFEERNDLALELKAKLRIVLRKLEYPENNRESVIYNILGFLMKQEVQS